MTKYIDHDRLTARGEELYQIATDDPQGVHEGDHPEAARLMELLRRRYGVAWTIIDGTIVSRDPRPVSRHYAEQAAWSESAARYEGLEA